MLRLRAERRWCALTPDGSSVLLPSGEVLALPAPVTDGTERRVNDAHSALLRSNTLDWVCFDDFVRYALMPWDERVVRREDEEALAWLALEPQLNGSSVGWELRLEPPRRGVPRMVCAMSPDALVPLRGLVRQTGARQGRIVPLFSLVLERWAVHLAQQDVVVIQAGANQAVAAAWLGGAFRWVRAFKGDILQLPQWIRRTHLASYGEDLPRCVATFFGDELPESLLELCPGPSDIEHVSAPADMGLAMVRYAASGS